MPNRKGIKNRKTLVREALMQKAAAAGVTLPLPMRGKLSYADMELILHAADAGTDQRDIGKLFQVHQSTVSRVVRQFEDTRPIAKRRLQGAALQVAEMALAATQLAGATGNAEPALEILDRIDVLAKRREDARGGANVLVVVGQALPSALPPGLTSVVDITES